MATIFQVYQNVSALNLQAEVQNAMDMTSGQLIRAQQKQRRDKGIEGAEYDPDYKRWKASIGRDVSVVNLTLYGDLNKQMFVEAEGDEFLISSGDEKLSKLEKKYGKDILEINPDYLGEYTEKSFFPKLKERIEKVTKLEMK